MLLLAGSYLFYAYWNVKLAPLRLISTPSDYGCGLGLRRQRRRQERNFSLSPVRHGETKTDRNLFITRVLGGLWHEDNPRGPERVFDIHLMSLKNLDFFVSAINKTYLVKFIELTQSGGIPVLFQLPPIAEKIINDKHGQKFLSQYLKFLIILEAWLPNFKLVSYKYQAYPTTALTGNSHHLNESASWDFTKKITGDAEHSFNSQGLTRSRSTVMGSFL